MLIDLTRIESIYFGQFLVTIVEKLLIKFAEVAFQNMCFAYIWQWSLLHCSIQESLHFLSVQL